MRKTLAIAIPAYERTSGIELNILSNIDFFKETGIPIYICDDSESDNVLQKIREIQKKYPNITYHKNNKRLGHDKNLLNSLKMPSEDYVWVMGDSTVVINKMFPMILDEIELNSPDLLSVNKDSRIKSKESGFFQDRNVILEEFAWHLSYTGATIYSKKVISLAFKNIKSYPANFPQVYIIFFSIANGSSFYWIQENCLTSKRSSTSYWVKNAINVFINDWSDALLSLSDTYSHDSIKKAVLSHSVQTKLFNWKIFVLLRMNNALDLAIVKKNHVRISDHSESNIFIVYLISLLPIFFIKYLYKIWLIIKI